MTYRQFVVPADAEILDALGVEPEPSADEPTIRSIRVDSGAGEQVVFSYDVPGRSVRVRWLRDSTPVLDLYRESATRLTVESGRGEARLTVTFESEGLGGDLEVQVYPAVRITDSLLFR
jgi:hypothetical protein